MLFNPSPRDEKIAACDLSCADYPLVNETEDAAMTNAEAPDAIPDVLRTCCLRLNLALTLGCDGSVCQDRNCQRKTNRNLAGDYLRLCRLSYGFHPHSSSVNSLSPAAAPSAGSFCFFCRWPALPQGR